MAEGWHVYALDHRGHAVLGRTPGRCRLSDYAGDAVAFLGHLREPALLLGQSLDGAPSASDLLPGAAAAGRPESDGLMTDAEVERALGFLAQGTHLRLRDVGHPLHHTHPDAVLRALDPFFSAV
jgi:pimeloyl-ACP methyl ester carboxylesterase